MQHVWQYYAKTNQGNIIKTVVTQSGRKGKVTRKIIAELKEQYTEAPGLYIEEFYIRQLR